MTINMKVRNSICEFYKFSGIYPNKIIMGYNLVNKLHKQFNTSKTLKEAMMSGTTFEYDGIPISIDTSNLNRLEVGYMVDYMDKSYYNY